MIKQNSKLTVLSNDAERISQTTRTFSDGESIQMDAIQVNCIDTPCHTRTHVAFYAVDINDTHEDSNGAVFVGDTLFIGGAGRFFEGNAGDLYRAMFDKLFKLPESTVMFCGHEYTESNLRWALSVEPENGRLSERMAKCAGKCQPFFLTS